MYQTDNDLRRYFDNNPGRLLHKWQHYFEIYDHHFSRYRGKPVTILEIGVFHGGSLQLWKSYFGPQAKIYGVDIDPRCKQFEEENVQILIGDQADRDFLRKLKEEIPRPDILIDDGGHLMHQQIITFEELYPFVADDGIYLCEDLHTSYWPEWGGGLRRSGTFIEYAKQLVDALNGFYIKPPGRVPATITQSAHSLHFYDSVMVVEKQRRDAPPEDSRSGMPVFEEGTIGSFPRPQLTFAVFTNETRGALRLEERLFIPLSASASRFKLAYAGWKDADQHQYQYEDALIHAADGYIIYGQFPDKLSADVLEHIFSSGKPVVYFFDEVLSELGSGEIRTKSGFRKYLIESLKLAHLIVVESEAQKNAYQTLNPRIQILPQKLDASLYSPVTPSDNGVLKVIYRGDADHLENLLMVSDALKQVADRHPGKLEFHFFGRGLAALGKHPAFSFNTAPATRQEWDATIQRIQPGLALMPLREDGRQELAGILPLLRFAAYGIPVLASNNSPYRDWVGASEAGLLAENKAEAWATALEGCLEYPHKLSTLGQNARRMIESGHALAESRNGGLASVLDEAVRKIDNLRPAKSAVDFMRLSDKPPYQKWLQSQRLQPRDLHWMKTEMALWERPPRFHLLMTLLPNQTQWLAATLDSLATQVNPHWLLTIVAFTPSPTGLVLDSRIRWYEVDDDEDSYDALNRFAVDEQSDWVGFIEAGDILQPQAFFKLGFHARRKPVWQIIYTDEDQISADSYRSNPLFKPDYNPGLLHAYPYTGGLCLFERELYASAGGLNGDKDGVEIYDLLLRCTERVSAETIGHIAEILYTRFERGGHSVRSWEEISQSSAQSLREHFHRRGIAAEVKAGPYIGTHNIVYPITRTPLVSILIPTRDHLELIKPCIDSLLEKTDYPSYEVLVLNNGSREAEVLEYFDEIRQRPNVRILDYPHDFNFSAMCNFGAREAKGEFLLLLNNDTEVTQRQWLSEMVRHGLRAEVGIVGARLLFPNGTVQHAGVVMGITAVADHPFIGTSPDLPGYMMRAQLTQNYSAVTAACMLIKKDLYHAVQGMDEEHLKILFNDVDLCLKTREAGYQIVWTPTATLTHKTSASIRSEQAEKKHLSMMMRKHHEYATMASRWLDWISYDPAYNCNLSLLSKQFSQEEDFAQGWDRHYRPAPRILAYPADTRGCGEYRIIAPCRALNKTTLAQACVRTSHARVGQLNRINPDVIILQRQIEDHQFHALDGMKRYSKAFRVFEIDDRLHGLTTSNLHRDLMHGDELERLAEGISLCDRLVTTTPALADAYGRFCNDVKIIPNYLERAKWAQLCPARLQGKRPRVGWAGSTSHTGDLELLYPVIKALHKDVDWIFLGMCPETLRPYILEFHEGVPLDSYPAKLASLNLDLALAPLEYHPFNEAKSALKILEYGILGYPVICTDIAAYQGEFPITRVSNKPAEWIGAIRSAIADRSALAEQGDLLRAHIQKNWMLEDNLNRWLQAWLP